MWGAPVTSRTLDALRPSAFLPYMLFRMFISSARRLRPSTGAMSPATLFAVVLGLVSESCARVSLWTECLWNDGGVIVLCSRAYRHYTVSVMLAHDFHLVAPSIALTSECRGEESANGVPLTPNFLKPLMVSFCWSCISTSECADASSDDGCSSFFAALFRGILPVWAVRRV